MIIFKMKKLLFVVVALGVFLQTANAQDQIIYTSKNLPKQDTTWVFKPKNYTSKEKTAVIFLLHGYGGNYKQWDNIMNAQKYADEYNVIIVCPDGLFSSWYINSPVKKDSQFESFFFDELYPDIKRRYAVDDRSIFISGLSMGGHGALHLFIKKPELFTSAGSTSGGVMLRDFSAKYGLSALLGNPSKEDKIWDDYSVVPNIYKLQSTNKPFIFDCGSEDFFYAYNNQLKQKADSLKLNATYISQPGAHNKAYWTKSIKQQFEFFQKQMIK